MVTQIVDSAASTLGVRLHGQTLRIPNLQILFDRWPSGVNPSHESLAKALEQNIESWIPDEHSRKKARKLNLALFCATWYPYASLDRLQTITWYTLWLFLWDDMIEASSAQVDPDSVAVPWLHEKALEYAEFHLGLSHQAEEPVSPTRCCNLFSYCGPGLRDELDEAQRKSFLDELRFYMEGCEGESEYVRPGELPDVQTYWNYRLGTTSVFTQKVLIEYTIGDKLPRYLLNSDKFETMFLEYNKNIVIVNDMLSLKKEMNDKTLFSLVPILMHETGQDLNTTIMALVQDLDDSMNKFDAAANCLLDLTEGDLDGFRATSKYIYGLRTNMTGHYIWSLACPRYNITEFLQQDKSLEIPL